MQHKTIDSVLARGEKLDSLVEKSSDLSAASQVVFKELVLMYVLKYVGIPIFLNESSKH
jgi:hypothetical protein